MGLYDRDYTQSGFRQQFYGPPQMRFNLPRITPVVKWLLISNIGIFILSQNGRVATFLEGWFAVDAQSWGTALQPWRIITYQFLHYGVWHIFLNMMALFFLGPPLERHWGSRRFLPFYLICGAAGGPLYLLLARDRFPRAGSNWSGRRGPFWGSSQPARSSFRISYCSSWSSPCRFASRP